MSSEELETESLPFLPIIEDLAGEEAVKIIKSIMVEEKTVREIVSETGLKVNRVRKTLYKLNKHRLVTYNKNEHKQNPFFREFFWRFNPQGVKRYIRIRKKVILRNLLENKDYLLENQVFRCKKHSDNMFTIDEAYKLNFSCPLCGSPLQIAENIKLIKTIENLINRLVDTG